jgi:hypothetical protein
MEGNADLGKSDGHLFWQNGTTINTTENLKTVAVHSTRQHGLARDGHSGVVSIYNLPLMKLEIKCRSLLLSSTLLLL